MSLKMGQVGSKTSSQGQILEKPSLHSRGHIFNLMLMKFDQNICLDEISDEFENGSCWLSNLVTQANHREKLMLVTKGL